MIPFRALQGKHFPRVALTQFLSWRRDLNPRPSDYKSDALPTELRQHGANRGNITKGNSNCKGPLWKTCANLTPSPMGSIQSPHPRSIFKAMLEELFYTLEAAGGKKCFG